MPKSDRKRRAHSLSSSEDESSKSQEDSENDGADTNPGVMKMPEMLDPGLYGDFQGKSLLQANNITKDDEIWVVQCPKNVDPNLLLQKKINFGGSSKVKLNLEDGTQQKLEISSENTSQQFLTCILQSSGRLQAVPLPLHGKLLVTERMEVADEDKVDFSHLSDKTGKVPLPQGLKLRHPLFGSDFANRISGPCYIKNKKEKKQKKRRRESEAETSMTLSETPRRKKRKISEPQEETPERTESPRKKHHKESNSDSEESSRKRRKTEVEVPSTPSSSKKIKTPKSIKKELLSDSELSTPKKKKKKKSKHHDDDDD